MYLRITWHDETGLLWPGVSSTKTLILCEQNSGLGSKNWVGNL
jgi:hypothetical protein